MKINNRKQQKRMQVTPLMQKQFTKTRLTQASHTFLDTVCNKSEE